MTGPTVREALRQGAARLARAGVPDAAGDVRRLMAAALGLGPDRLTLHLGDRLDPGQSATWESFLAARAMRQPVSQIVGKREFWGRTFRVTRDTLDPRPETEILVASALARPFLRALDLGTGTGAILLSLLADRPEATGVGTDISAPALAVAEANAEVLGLAGRAAFLLADWFGGVQGRFDLIVANPPYIAADEMADLAPDVRDWEPHLALTPGGDGLSAYRAIAAGAAGHLAPGGRLLLEIGPTQAGAVSALLAAGGLRVTGVDHDFDGRERVVVADRA